MRVPRLSFILFVVALVATLVLLVLGIWAVAQVRAYQEQIQDLVALQGRANDISATSDALLLDANGEAAYDAFRDDARALQGDLSRLAGRSASVARAVSAVDDMIDLADAHVRPDGEEVPPSGDAGRQGPLRVTPQVAQVMSRMAAHGRQLDAAVASVLRERYAAGARAASIAVGGLFGAALAFALSSLLAFWILHRRLGEPVGELADVVARVSAGDDTARAEVRGDHELARLGTGLNAMLDHKDRIEAVLSERSELLAESQRLARIGSWRRHIDTDQHIWTEQTYRIVGRSPEAYRPRTFPLTEMAHPDDLPIVEAIRASVLEGEDRSEGQFRIVRPDGEVRHVYLRGELTRDAAGRPKYVSGTMQDITMLVEALETVRTHRQVLEMAGRVARFGGWTVDLERDEVTWSDIACDIHEAPYGTKPSLEKMISYVVPEHRSRLRRAFERAVQDGAAFEEELQIVTERGQRLWVRTAGEPVRNQKGTVAVIQGALQDIDRQKRDEQELERLAYTDQLTGLYSRDGLVHVLEQRLRDDGWTPQGRVVALDVSALRNVNEAYGYAAGDALLTSIGQRLAARAGARGLVARTGGGGFAVYLLEPTPAAGVMRTLLGSDEGRFDVPFQVSGRELRVAANLGYTELGHESRGVETLLREAEMALHAARRGAEANGAAYTRRLHHATTARVALAHELGTAVEDGELVLHYQPKVDLESGRLVAAEALVRWNHPRDGLLMPGAFIDVAERSGLISPIGLWVLHEACRVLRSWQDEGLDIVRVAINVSVEQLRFGRFAEEVRRAIEQHGVAPHGLTLEITESVFLHESELLRTQLRELHDLGVRISLDDFGTGFASLAYLRNYPFDKIKIDRSFVRGLPDDAYGRNIVTTVLGIASSIGAETIAEGIETAEQRDALLELGCRVGQGYYYSKPVERDAFRELLSRREALPLQATP